MITVDHSRRVGSRLALLALLAGLGTAGTGLAAAHAASAATAAPATAEPATDEPATAGTRPALSPATWSVQHTPRIPDPNGGLAGVSCATSDFCAAVAAPGIAGPPLYLWNGHSWRAQSVPHGKHWRAVLVDVSCTSPAFCLAVGYRATTARHGPALFVVWRGTSWATVPISLAGEATGVSCSSATACFAVGGPPGKTAWAERWDGTSWTGVKLAPVGKDYALNTVSCSGASACTAVGSDLQGITVRVLIERWNGTDLAVQRSAEPAKATVYSVSCPQDDGCVAVGSTGASGTTPFAERWNGTAWTAMRPAAAPGMLNGVSCTTVTACTAVGLRGSDNSSHTTLAERLSGTAWTVQHSPAISGTRDGSLEDVACLAGGGCLATGNATTLSYASESVGEWWTGTKWNLLTTPNYPYADQQGQFTGVSCPAAKACEAFGYYNSSLLSTQPVSASWNGSKWAVNAAISAPRYVQTTGISCSSATSCMAVGDHGGGRIPPWAEVWDGTNWTKADPPPPSGRYTSLELSGVSCASATFCVTLGTVEAHGGNYAYAYRWNGSAWTVMPMPNVPDATLSAVSCLSADWCMAVGSGSNWVAETWNGTAWTVQATTGSPVIDAVSCSSPAACTAVGSAAPGAPPAAAVERWNGTAWLAQQPGPNPAGTAGIQLSGVSCATATACTAVGSYSRSDGAVRAIIESWTGGTWVRVPPPTKVISQLASVSCSSATACTAVGEQAHGSNHAPLVESSG